MIKTTFNPSNARKKNYQLLKDVNKNHAEIQIVSERDENNAVLIILEDWKSIQETLVLEQTGVLDEVKRREKDKSGFTEIDKIDWDSL